MGDAATVLGRLQEWYRSRCDGDWEHSYGVKVETLDNPGWLVTVDLEDTPWEQLAAPRSTVQRSETGFRARSLKASSSGAAGQETWRKFWSGSSRR
jgi:hypothetical protein